MEGQGMFARIKPLSYFSFAIKGEKKKSSFSSKKREGRVKKNVPLVEKLLLSKKQQNLKFWAQHCMFLINKLLKLVKLLDKTLHLLSEKQVCILFLQALSSLQWPSMRRRWDLQAAFPRFLLLRLQKAFCIAASVHIGALRKL